MGANGSKPLSTAPTVEASADEYPVYDRAKAPHWTTDCKEVRDPVLSKSGVASEASTTLIKWFQKIAADPIKGPKDALAVERPLPPMDGKKASPALPRDQWTTWTYVEYYNECRVAAKAMLAMGCQQCDGVNIYGFNAPEWFMGEMSAIFAGGIAAGIYPSDTDEQVQFKSAHSNASIAVCQTKKQADVFLKFAAAGKLPNLKGVIVWDDAHPFETTEEGKVNDHISLWCLFSVQTDFLFKHSHHTLLPSPRFPVLFGVSPHLLPFLFLSLRIKRYTRKRKKNFFSIIVFYAFKRPHEN